MLEINDDLPESNDATPENVPGAGEMGTNLTEGEAATTAVEATDQDEAEISEPLENNG